MIRERIVDYAQNKDNVEKWLELKGEWRYSDYADFLESINLPLTWSNLDNTYCYDKRLMFTLYRYFSMFEEYLRACYVRNNGNTREAYDAAQKLYLSDFEEIIPKDDLWEIKELRNDISHAKPLITNKLTQIRIGLLHTYLPKGYRTGFVTSINDCAKKLDLDPLITLKLV